MIINFHLQRGSQHRGNLPSTPSMWSPKCDTCRESQGHGVYCDKLQTERKTAPTQLSWNNWGFGFNTTWLSIQNGGPGSHWETRPTTANLAVWWSKTACIKILTVWVAAVHIFNLTCLKIDIVQCDAVHWIHLIQCNMQWTATSLLYYSVREPQSAHFDHSVTVLYHFKSVGYLELYLRTLMM